MTDKRALIHPQKLALAGVTVLGGLAVVGSYVWGLTSIPNASTDFWGGTPEPLIPLFTASMLLGAAGFFAFTSFLLLALDPARARVGSRLGFGAFIWIYLAVLVPSALWMPLVALMVDSPNEPLWWAIRLVLFAVAAAAVALLIALLRVEPRKPAWLHGAAVAGAFWFTVHTLVLDAILWPLFFR